MKNREKKIVTAKRTALEGPLQEFVDGLQAQKVVRVPGAAIFPHPNKATTPLALRANLQHNGVLHKRVVIVSAAPTNAPTVPADERIQFDDLGYDDDGIFHLTVRYGFSEKPDVPQALRHARDLGLMPAGVDPDTASYFLSRASLRATRGPGLARWRKALFVVLAHNAANPSEYFGLPVDRTVVMGGSVDI